MINLSRDHVKISYSARFHLVRIIRVRDYLARLCFWFPVYYRLPFYIRVSYIDSEPVNSEVLVSKFDLMTVFAETKSVTKSRLHCTLVSIDKKIRKASKR